MKHSEIVADLDKIRKKNLAPLKFTSYSPKISLFKIVVMCACFLFIGWAISAFVAADKVLNTFTERQPQTHVQKTQEIPMVIVSKDSTLSTTFFDIQMMGRWIRDYVDMGNEYQDLPLEPDTKYLILRLKYKNTDTESRMIGDGQVLINYQGKDYNFDHPEQIMIKGFATGLEQINPLTSLSTLFVYKLPKEIKGKAYFHPGRTDDRHFIEIGELK